MLASGRNACIAPSQLPVYLSRVSGVETSTTSTVSANPARCRPMASI